MCSPSGSRDVRKDDDLHEANAGLTIGPMMGVRQMSNPSGNRVSGWHRSFLPSYR